MKSATTAGDSDFGLAESCVAESCASFEFVDEDGQRADDEDEKTEQIRSQHPPSPPKAQQQQQLNGGTSQVLNGGGAATTTSSSAVCSPSGASEIGSVFGLRFDPQENKMTLQLTAAPGDMGPAIPTMDGGPTAIEVSKLQPSRFPLDLNSPTRTEGGLFPSLKSQAKKSEYENATDDERKALVVVGSATEADVDVLQKEQEQVRQILASAAALQAETSQSEWSEDEEEDDEGDDISESDEHGADAGGDDDECQGPLLGGSSRKPSGSGRNRFRRSKFRFAGLTSDIESTGYTTDDAGLENVSVFNDAGLTDAEGALSDINSLLNDGIPYGDDRDMADDTSLSSRASSRFFDSEPILSLESFTASAGQQQLAPGKINTKVVAGPSIELTFFCAGKTSGSMLYDSEYDNYGQSSLASDGEAYDDSMSASGQLLGDEKIRRVSQHITRSFGQQQNNITSSSDSEDV